MSSVCTVTLRPPVRVMVTKFAGFWAERSRYSMSTVKSAVLLPVPPSEMSTRPPSIRILQTDATSLMVRK